MAAAPRLVVGALVVDDLREPTRVLAARRISPPELAGRWEFPGGKVESGETPKDALVRELFEELSIEVVVGDELRPPGGGTWPISDRYELRLFYAELIGGVPQPGDSHEEARWLGSDDLAGLDWLDSDRAALPYVLTRG